MLVRAKIGVGFDVLVDYGCCGVSTGWHYFIATIEPGQGYEFLPS